MDNRCVCCGEIIPEGLQVCPKCMMSVETTICRRCGRRLKTPDAIARGMGDTCYRKSKERKMGNKLF